MCHCNYHLAKFCLKPTPKSKSRDSIGVILFLVHFDAKSPAQYASFIIRFVPY